MAFILITDNPQGGACRCEGQELDLANLSPEQVEALKQALGVSEKQAVFDPEKLSEENVVALREKIFDILSSDGKFFDRNYSALNALLLDTMGANYSHIATGIFEIAIESDPEGLTSMVYNNIRLDDSHLHNRQGVESIASKLGVFLATPNGKVNLSDVIKFLLASAVSSDSKIDALKAELAELKTQLAELKTQRNADE